MAVEFSNLGIHLFHADASQQLQNMFLTGDRAAAHAAAGQAQEEAKAKADEQVQESEETENPEVNAEEGGQQGSSGDEQENSEEKKPPPKPEDPSGRGQIIDVNG